MSYFRNTDDDRPLSARDGRSIKDHVDVLHFVVLKQTEAVEKLQQKIKNIEESLEDKSDTSTCEENDENDENEIPDTTPNSRLWKGLWSAGALLTSIGIYLGFSRYSNKHK